MTSHFGLMILFALFVSLVFAVIAKDQPGDQFKTGAKRSAASGSRVRARWVMRISRCDQPLAAGRGLDGRDYYGSTTGSVPGRRGTCPTRCPAHLGYAGLAILALRATSRGTWAGVTLGALALALVIATVHGLSVEWLQMRVPTRSAEWRDVVNDVLGALLGLLPVWAWSKIRSA